MVECHALFEGQRMEGLEALLCTTFWNANILSSLETLWAEGPLQA